MVFTIEGGLITDRQLVAKQDFHQQHDQGCHEDGDREHRGNDPHAEEKHRQMFTPLADCEALIARGMGMGAYRGLQQVGVQPMLTDLEDIQVAVAAYMAGELVDHLDRVHHH